MLRIAFTDLLYSWPPNGGADIDLHHVLTHLQSSGVEVKLFFASIEGADDRGIADPAALPFPAERVHFERNTYRPDHLAARFREAVDAFAPQAAFVTHGFAMKPFLLEALAHLPLASRYFAHELTCARDPRRFKNGAPCHHDYLNTPDICRACALESQQPFIATGNHRAWTADYLAAKAYEPQYHTLALSSLRHARTLIVYNSTLREELLSFHPDVRVFPGGADVGSVEPQRQDNTRTIILMAGRADDPLKGMEVLNEAGRLLWQQRQDFQIVVTHYDHALQTPWLTCAGWRNHAETLALYNDADIVSVPSVWQEPFGLVAVEAMAAARPVVASDVGGLHDIVRHESTGLRVPPANAPALAQALARLLDDPALRQRMGKEGRCVAEAEYDWGRVIATHYLPLIQEMIA